MLDLQMQPSRRVSELTAWAVILGVVAVMVYANLHRPQKEDEIRLGDIRITLGGKEAIGLKSLQARSGVASVPGWSDANARLIDAIERDASTPADSFHIAIIAGDIQGKDQALKRLDKLSNSTIPSELADDITALREIYAGGAAMLDSKARESLIQHHDFFGRVALSYGLDPNVEARKSVEQSAQRTLVLLGLVSAALLLLAAASIGFFITAIVLIKKRKIQLAYKSDAAASSVFLEAFALYIALFVAFGVLARQLGLTNFNWNWLPLVLIPIAMFWARHRGATADDCRKAFGWHCGQGWHREIAAGIAGYLAGLVFVVVGLFITFILIKFTGTAPPNPIIQMLKGNRWHVLALYGVACVLAPVLEETMFRGALFHHMRRRWRWLISAPVVASIFAIIHPQGWVAFPALAIIALVLAGLREWRGSIIAPMAAHACNNFIVLTFALLLLR